MPSVRCLSIRQPFVELILRGIKKVENRSWFTPYRGWLAIQASKNTSWIKELGDDLNVEGPRWKPTAKDFGTVLGFVVVVDCCRFRKLPAKLQSDGFADNGRSNWCWVLRNPIRLAKPVKAVGNAGYFNANIPTKLIPRNVADPLGLKA